MTCIVGLIDNNKLYMGSDSRVTTGHILPVNDSKILIRENMLIGISGDVRYSNIIEHYLNIPYHRNDVLTMEYICTDFITSLRTIIEEQKFSEERNKVSSVPNDSMILIGYKNKLYSIWGDYSVVEFYDYYAIGSGGSYAVGSLETTRNMNLDPKKRIELALESACKFSVWCAPPFNIIEREISQ